MIVVRISGGLGNQLFQFAFGKYLEKKLQTSVFFDDQTKMDVKNVLNRDLDLLQFKFQVPIASKSLLKKFRKSDFVLFYRIERKLIQLFPFLQKSYVVQPNAHYPVEIRDNTYYNGYWQSYVYPDEMRHFFLEHIQLSETSKKKNKKLINELKNSDSVAVHIRRDDYISIKVNQKIFCVCDFGYYQRAMDSIVKEVSNPVFYIFTQDKEWAKNHFVGDQFVFVEGNSGVEDMLLMSYCKHNIIANSTFSWWSAWLNQNPQKIVIAPKSWYKGKLNLYTSNLIPQQWIRK